MLLLLAFCQRGGNHFGYHSILLNSTTKTILTSASFAISSIQFSSQETPYNHYASFVALMMPSISMISTHFFMQPRWKEFRNSTSVCTLFIPPICLIAYTVAGRLSPSSYAMLLWIALPAVLIFHYSNLYIWIL